jgi:hypothetical protein
VPMRLAQGAVRSLRDVPIVRAGRRAERLGRFARWRLYTVVKTALHAAGEYSRPGSDLAAHGAAARQAPPAKPNQQHRKSTNKPALDWSAATARNSWTKKKHGAKSGSSLLSTEADAFNSD